MSDAFVPNPFGVEYQPVWIREANRLTHVEAFIRWSFFNRRPVSPGTLMPILADQGLDRHVDAWVAQQALEVVRRFRQDQAPVTLGLRLPSSGLISEGWVLDTVEWVRRARMRPCDILWAVSEKFVPTANPRIWHTLRETGFRLALDHVGSGASFTALTLGQFDVLKIDRQFVNAMESGADDERAHLVRAMIQLGHDLGCQVWAEGVERLDAARSWLIEVVDGLQGYGVARPMTADELAPYLLQFSGLPVRLCGTKTA